MNGCFSWTAKGCAFLFWMFWISVPIRVLSSGDSRLSKDALINILDMDPQLSFLRNRDHFTSSALGVRPYTLSLNKDDYLYGPKPKHLRTGRLIRLLGSSFDPFWMSIQRPDEASVRLPEGDLETVSQISRENETLSFPNYAITRKSFNMKESSELIASAAHYQQKLEKEAEDLDLGMLSTDAAALLRKWLVQSATCSLRYKWVDLGPVFWPRWLRHTDCDKAGNAQTCSFPSGMVCRRAQVTHLKILAWHCWGSVRESKSGEKNTGAGFLRKKCVWRQVPYPVVTACKCSCK